jgi:hypothetical protein
VGQGGITPHCLIACCASLQRRPIGFSASLRGADAKPENGWQISSVASILSGNFWFGAANHGGEMHEMGQVTKGWCADRKSRGV